jgi:hypothetical protein
MTGNQLKELFETLITRDNLCKELCQDLLDELDGKAQGQLKIDYINNAVSRLDLLYKLRHSNNTSWSESADKNFSDWRRVRAAVEHENHLIGQRLTWLLSSQTVLITAYTLAFVEWAKGQSTPQAANVYPALLLIIAIFGITLSAYIWRTLVNAVAQLNKLERWWYGDREWSKLLRNTQLLAKKPYGNEESLIKENPPLHGRTRSIFDVVINAETTPLLFIGAWLSIVIFSGISQFAQIADAISQIWKEILLVILSVVVIFFIGREMINNRRHP